MPRNKKRKSSQRAARKKNRERMEQNRSQEKQDEVGEEEEDEESDCKVSKNSFENRNVESGHRSAEKQNTERDCKGSKKPAEKLNVKRDSKDSKICAENQNDKSDLKDNKKCAKKQDVENDSKGSKTRAEKKNAVEGGSNHSKKFAEKQSDNSDRKNNKKCADNKMCGEKQTVDSGNKDSKKSVENNNEESDCIDSKNTADKQNRERVSKYSKMFAAEKQNVESDKSAEKQNVDSNSKDSKGLAEKQNSLESGSKHCKKLAEKHYDKSDINNKKCAVKRKIESDLQERKKPVERQNVAEIGICAEKQNVKSDSKLRKKYAEQTNVKSNSKHSKLRATKRNLESGNKRNETSVDKEYDSYTTNNENDSTCMWNITKTLNSEKIDPHIDAQPELCSLMSGYMLDQAQKQTIRRENISELNTLQRRTEMKLKYIQEKRKNEDFRHKERINQRICKRIKRQIADQRLLEQRQNTLQRKIKRQDTSVMEAERKSNTKFRKRKREDISVRAAEQKSNTEFRKRIREDISVRAAERKSNTEFRKRKREDISVRAAERNSNTEFRKRKREDISVRAAERKSDTEYRKRKREDISVRAAERKSDTEFRKRKREDISVRAAEQKSDTKFRKRKREDISVRAAERKSNTEFRKRKRKDISVRAAERKSNTKFRKSKREDSTVRAAERRSDADYRKCKREDSSVRAAERMSEAEYHRRKREDPTVREVEKRENTNSRRNKRQSSNRTVASAIGAFKSNIQNGPTYICTVCNRLLYKKSVSYFKLCHFDTRYFSTVEKCRTKKTSLDDQEYICSSCKNSLKKGLMPSLALANGLQLDDIPDILQDLTSLENTFIARRIPFMKLLALPRGKQRSIHGCVINVPVEPEQSVSVLPRVPSSSSLIPCKLKRKLKYRGHMFSQKIRPQKIKDALYILKNNMNNKLYRDVTVNEDWLNESRHEDKDLWNSLNGIDIDVEVDEAKEDSADERDDADDNHDESEDTEQEDERSKYSGALLDTCLQPKDISAQCNLELSIAPGEGKRPVGIEMDKNSEELSFPQLFPSGRFGFSYERDKRLTMKKYFQSRLLNCDGRFSKNIEYIFYSQYRCEAKDVKDSISIALRKGKQSDLTAGEVKEKVSQLIRNDLGVHFLQKVRGSPAFFNKLLYDLLGTIRQLGPCTWFVTLSAADLKWSDTLKIISAQQGKSLTNEEVEHLTWEERTTLIRSNPITAARHFDYRVENFMKHIILNKNINPLGEITDYKYRIEFQQRGSPHVHMVCWAKDAPTFADNDESEILSYVQDKLSCTLPEDESLRDMLLLIQKHNHSQSCRKHGESCRYSFPRFPMRETIAVKPPDSPVPAAVQEIYKDVLQAVAEQLKDLQPNTDLSLDTLLQKVKVQECLYTNAVKWLKTKSGQPAILLKRDPSEVCINNYNTTLMKAWEANLDVQFVTNVYACIMYVASYMSKPEKTLGDVLKAVSSSSQELGPKSSMKTVAKKFLSHREVSAQEAAFRILSLPLTQGSREIIFLHTDLPENRTRLFKPMIIIKNMDDDDPDVFLLGLLDRYMARPLSLQEMCFAHFASTYRRVSATNLDDKPNEEDIGDDVNDAELPDKIILQDGMGQMTKRKRCAIVRSHQWSVKKVPEQYYHAQLLLYYPWRNEKQNLYETSYQESYNAKIETIQTNRARFEKHADEVHNAIEDLENMKDDEDLWNELAPTVEQMRQDDMIEGAHVEEHVLSTYDSHSDTSVSKDLGIPVYEYELSSEKMSNQDWYKLILSLNDKQYKLHQFIVEWCSKMILTHQTARPAPFHIFLTGGAGVGKSFLVRTIVQTITRILTRNYQNEENHVLVCAPTGSAAYNISGHTLHAAFQLPVFESKSSDYTPLSGERLAGLKEAIGSVKVIIIDEISFVGSDMLLTVHRRLCDLKGCDEPFGGISILAVGDLFQLPPVGQRPVFAPPSDEIAALYGSLWKNHFRIVKLTEIQRQKNDETFASLLNRVRVGEQTQNDINLLNSRQTSKESPDYPKEATHIFAFNRNVDTHNSNRLLALNEEKVTIQATDSQKDTETGHINITSFPDKAGGLPKEITLCTNARVVLIKNIDVTDGLVNSASGTITGFIPPISEQDLDTYKPKYVLVRFDEERVGKKHRNVNKSILSDTTSTPIPQVETQIHLRRNSPATGKRTMFPLKLAWGLTIHKEQGKTEDELVLSCEGAFRPGQFYTAISRTKEMTGLHILGQVESKMIKVNRGSLLEMKRMEVHSRFVSDLPVTLTVRQDVFFKIFLHNINSLNAHKVCFQKEEYYCSSHVTCLVETWLTAADDTPNLPTHGTLRTDNASNRRKGGLLTYINYGLHVIKHVQKSRFHTDHQMFIVSPTKYPWLRMAIITIYNNPKTRVQTFLLEFETIIHTVPQGLKCFIVGDFNIDLLRESSTKKNFKKLINYYGFHQLFRVPTHRKGGLLDNIFINFHLTGGHKDVLPVYYSDHFILGLCVPFQDLL